MAGVETGRRGRNLYPCVVDKQTGTVYGGKKGVIVQIVGSKVKVIREIAEVDLNGSVIYPGEKYGGVRLVPETKPNSSFLSKYFS